MNQEEKKEQLKLTRLRLNVLRKRTGQNIIDSFQKINQKREEEEIELILEEASAFGLRQEVKELAEKELKEASMKGVWLSRLDAYVNAYNEWIK